MIAAFTVMRKDLLLLWREPHAMVFTIGFPLLFGVFFGAIYASSANGDARAPIAIVDKDDTAASARLAAGLREHRSLVVTEAADEDAALTLVRRGDVAAAVVMRSGFGQRIGRIGATAMNDDDGASVSLVVDPSRNAAVGFLEGVLAANLTVLRGERLAESFAAPNADANAVSAALDPAPLIRRSEIDEREGQPLHAYELTFAQSIVWAMIGCCAAFAVTLVRERDTGTLVRLRLAPGGALSGLLGKAFACAATACAVALLFATLGVVGFGVTIERPLLLFVAVVCGSVCFAGLMMLLAVVARGHASPGQLAWGVLLMLAITGGGMLPLAFMPPWLSAVSHLSPVRWAIVSVEAAVWRDLNWSGATPTLALLTAFAIAAFGLGAGVMLRERSADG